MTYSNIELYLIRDLLDFCNTEKHKHDIEDDNIPSNMDNFSCVLINQNIEARAIKIHGIWYFKANTLDGLESDYLPRLYDAIVQLIDKQKKT